MTPTEARHFLETCNEQIEAGMTAELRRKILAARDILAADRRARLAADASRLATEAARRRRTIGAADEPLADY